MVTFVLPDEVARSVASLVAGAQVAALTEADFMSGQAVTTRWPEAAAEAREQADHALSRAERFAEAHAIMTAAISEQATPPVLPLG